MSDNTPSGDKSDLERITETIERLGDKGALEVRVRESDTETEISVKYPMPATGWATLWLTLRKVFGGLRKFFGGFGK